MVIFNSYVKLPEGIDCNSRLCREWITRGVWQLWRLQGSSTMEDMQEFQPEKGALGLSKRARNINYPLVNIQKSMENHHFIAG